MNIKSQFSKALFFLLLFLSIIVFPQEPGEENYREICTSIMVGRKATHDGSVITAHTCDAYLNTASVKNQDTQNKMFFLRPLFPLLDNSYE